MKEQITISIEPEALETARAEVAAGRAPEAVVATSDQDDIEALIEPDDPVRLIGV